MRAYALCYAICMGILVENSEKRSELGDRITADLYEKNKLNSLTSNEFEIGDHDFVAKKEAARAGRYAWFWFILFILAAVSIVVILI